MDSFLTELRQSLERLGYVVVPHKEHVCVRLSLFASIRVYSSEGRIWFVPQFGPFRRTTGLLVTSTAVTGAVGAVAFTAGVTPLAFLTGILGIIALAHDACRFVLTESCITRVQQVIAEIDRTHPARRLTTSPLPHQIGGEHGVDVVPQPAGRTPVAVHRPGQ